MGITRSSCRMPRAMNVVINTHYCQVTMKLKYCWEKSKTGPLYYRRTYPKDIREILLQRGEQVGRFRVESLGTRDVGKVTKLIAALAKKDDIEWERLRNGMHPESRFEAGLAYLERFHLTENRELTIEEEVHEDLFYDSLRTLVPEDECVNDHLNEAQLAALDIRQGRYRPTLSDAKAEYLRTRPSSDRKKMNTVNNAFDLVSKYVGDAFIQDIKRKDVAHIIDLCLAEGKKTGTINRLLGTVRTAVKELLHHHELDGKVRNPFREYKIPDRGKDVEKRQTLSVEQQLRLRSYVEGESGITSNILGLILDTGMRIGEAAGLRVEDVVLHVPVPYVAIVPFENRTLKTEASIRKVPLVGISLVAARRAVNESVGEFLFHRYGSSAKVKNDAASQTVNKALKKLDCLTVHSLRHTMSYRLKSANVAEPRIDEILGWSRKSMSAYYGGQSALEAMREDMLKTL